MQVKDAGVMIIETEKCSWLEAEGSSREEVADVVEKGELLSRPTILYPDHQCLSMRPRNKIFTQEYSTKKLDEYFLDFETSEQVISHQSRKRGRM